MCVIVRVIERVLISIGDDVQQSVGRSDDGTFPMKNVILIFIIISEPNIHTTWRFRRKFCFVDFMMNEDKKKKASSSSSYLCIVWKAVRMSFLRVFHLSWMRTSYHLLSSSLFNFVENFIFFWLIDWYVFWCVFWIFVDRFLKASWSLGLKRDSKILSQRFLKSSYLNLRTQGITQ